jgi:uncharacterized protein
VDTYKLIFDAITAGDLDSLKEQLAGDSDLAKARDEEGVSALLMAKYHNQEDLASFLIENLDELDIFEAAACNNVERAQELALGNPKLVQTYAGDGFAPLHLACFFGHIETAMLFLECGADVNIVASNPSRVEPLHSAVASDNLELVAMLLEHHADPNAQQVGGRTPLQSAARRGHKDMVEALLKSGAKLDIVAESGKTARELAANEEIRALLED